MPLSSPELGNRLLQAGAGAGKTTTLVATFISFVKAFRQTHQNEYPRIVVTTFTRKATQEVRERLMKKALELGEVEIFDYLGEKSRVHISTIHGLLSLFLARYGDRLGLPADFRFVSDAELKWLSRRELRRVLAEGGDGLELLENYDFTELWKALEMWREKVVPHQGAGLVMVDWFRQKTLQSLSQLCEEASALSEAIPHQTKNARLLEWGEVLGRLGPCPQTDQQIESLLDLLVELDESFGTKPSAALSDPLMNERKKAFKEIWDLFSDAKKQMSYRPSFWQRHQARCERFEKVGVQWLERVEKIRKSQGLLSMADLETLSLQLIRLDPETAVSFSREWDYWMIDEYQDTSPVQVELLKHLVGNRPHFVVGDPQQSIYFFRGARSQVFYEKKDEFEQRQALVESVVVNHRSRTPLLEFFNAFFLSRSAFSPMKSKPKRTAFPPDFPATEIRLLEKEESRDVTVAAAIERVQELLRHPEVRPESICVLSRTNDPLRRIQSEARALGLPVQLHTAGGFAVRREVRDVLAFLRFLLNPYDNLNFLTLLRSPWFHLKDEELVTYCRGGAFWVEALRSEPETSDDHALTRLRTYLKKSAQVGLAETLKAFYRQEGILDSTRYIDPSGRREANLWKILVQLENAQRNPGFNALTFIDSLDRRVVSTEEGNEDGDAVPAIEPKRVQLMTVHASKGLEFDHVIILGLEKTPRSERASLLMIDEGTGRWTLGEKDLSGSLRSSLLVEEIIERRNQLLLEESQRVLYVAMTRAMQTLSLIWEKAKTKSGMPPAASWAALVPFDLTPGEHQQEHFRYRVRDDAPVVQTMTTSKEPVPELKARWASKSPMAHVQITSPTDLLETSRSLVDGITRSAEFAAEGLRVAQRGTDAHRLFEALKYASLEDVMKMTTDVPMQEGLRWLVEQSDLPLISVIQNGEVEWGFTAKQGSMILQGQVDLWGHWDGEVWIVDYKTGSSRSAAKALDQMKIYAWALLHLRQIEPGQVLHLVAVYPLEKKSQELRFDKVEDLRHEWERLMPVLKEELS